MAELAHPRFQLESVLMAELAHPRFQLESVLMAELAHPRFQLESVLMAELAHPHFQLESVLMAITPYIHFAITNHSDRSFLGKQVNARHPDGITMAGRILRRFPCGAFWGMIKVARVSVPSVKPQPSFMDAPGEQGCHTHRGATSSLCLVFEFIKQVPSRSPGLRSWTCQVSESLIRTGALQVHCVLCLSSLHWCRAET